MRLRPFTHQLPKPLLPLMNRPFIQYLLQYLKSQKMKDVVLTLSHKAEEMMEYIQQQPVSDLSFLLSVEKEPLGTAGALKNVEAYLEGESILVMNGDILTDFPLHELIHTHKKKKAKVTIALKEVDDPSPFGLVTLGKDSRVRKFIEKPTEQEWAEERTINAGIYIIDVDLIGKIPAAQPVSLEREFFPLLIADDVPIFGQIFDGYWLDVGSFSSYFKAHRDIFTGKISVHLSAKSKDGIWIQERVKIGANVELNPPVFIGENSVIDDGAVISEYTVIGSRNTIQREARIEGCILHSDVIVGEKARLRESILGKGVIIESEVLLRAGNILGNGCVVTQGSIFPASF